MKNPIHLFSLTFFFFVGCITLEKEKNIESNSKNSILIADKQFQEKTELQKSMQRGKNIYSGFCMQCHLPDGKGVPGNFPPLAGSDWLTEKRSESIYVVKYGQTGEIIVNGVKYNNVMAPLGLSDDEVADVMNYIMNSWENTQNQMVTVEEVKAVKK
ncbi:MAG: cytochrome C [Bacteroidetes bacterium HGW-Bacteroidetes-2]|jgi:mono/diheme cytochrome c family protein|nr:MAG: cytochrome C [Bacteroidetes bacterium HGW-Bacteroidetes-8]PKP26764.1 MAG: cytochrome C [Bacteroidetes bacterium HGW-Bacteroidetes-2]